MSQEATNQNSNNQIEKDLYTEKREIRERIFEKKEVVHHERFNFFTGHEHTHAQIYNITYSEERTIKTYKDGTIEITDWTIIQGSKTKELIETYQENGWTDGYEIEISKN